MCGIPSTADSQWNRGQGNVFHRAIAGHLPAQHRKHRETENSDTENPKGEGIFQLQSRQEEEKASPDGYRKTYKLKRSQSFFEAQKPQQQDRNRHQAQGERASSGRDRLEGEEKGTICYRVLSEPHEGEPRPLKAGKRR